MIEFHEDFPSTSPRLALTPTFSDYVEDVVLAADTLVRVAIPASARFVLFSFDADVRVKLGVASSSFALPTAATGNGSGSELNPSARRIPNTLGDGTSVPTHVLLRSPAACRGSLTFYA